MSDELKIYQHERGDCACGAAGAWLYSLTETLSESAVCGACITRRVRRLGDHAEESQESDEQHQERAAYLRNANADRYHRLVAEGLCVACGKRKPEAGRRRCPVCAKALRSAMSDVRARDQGPDSRRAA